MVLSALPYNTLGALGRVTAGGNCARFAFPALTLLGSKLTRVNIMRPDMTGGVWRAFRNAVSCHAREQPREGSPGKNADGGDSSNAHRVKLNDGDFFEPKGFSRKMRADLDEEPEFGKAACKLSKPLEPGNLDEPSMEELHAKFITMAEKTKSYDFAVPKDVLKDAAEAHVEDVDASPVPEVEGFVHSIESLSAVDGPGLRYVLFVQGCAYRCVFCSNPDSWEIGAGVKMTSKEIARQIARAVPYLKHGGGGVTVSGGDPMLQPEFVGAIFQECRRMGVPTAIDTTGMGSKGLWRKLLPYTDMVMLCVKAPKPDMYRKITGGFNQDAMLRFAAVTHMMGIPLWLRYVLLPDKTDSDYDVEWLAQFCKDHSNVKEVDILPYHTLGVHKWEVMGLEYPLTGQRSPTKDEVKSFMGKLEDKIRGMGVEIIATGVA